MPQNELWRRDLIVPTFLAAEEIERQYVEKMGPKLGDIYYRLFNECARVHEKWSEYAEIFGVKERVELVELGCPLVFSATAGRALGRCITPHC